MRNIITVYTAMFFDKRKDFLGESKGFLTKDAAMRKAEEYLGKKGVKYVSVEKYYKLED